MTNDAGAAAPEQDPDAERWKVRLARKYYTDARITALVKNAEMDLSETTDEVMVTLRTPLDFEDSDGRYRLFRIRAGETRFTGKRDVHPGQSDKPVEQWVHGYVHYLTQKGKRHKGQYPGWIELAPELAKDLLSWGDQP